MKIKIRHFFKKIHNIKIFFLLSTDRFAHSKLRSDGMASKFTRRRDGLETFEKSPKIWIKKAE